MNTSPAFDLDLKSIPEPNTGCYLYIGATDKDGYGVVSGGHKRTLRAHRASYETYCGPIPNRLQVLHHCDTPACVNPSHLFLGTNRDNVADRNHKRRSARGARQGLARLDDARVAAVIRLLAQGKSHNSIAKTFNVSRKAIWMIAHGISWRHVTGLPPAKE